MFTAPFTSAFIVAPHDSQTYGPRSTRFASRFRPQHQHVFDVFRSDTRSTRIPCSSALYSKSVVKRSNSHPWSFLFPRLPQFRESPCSSSRILLKSPLALVNYLTLLRKQKNENVPSLETLPRVKKVRRAASGRGGATDSHGLALGSGVDQHGTSAQLSQGAREELKSVASGVQD